MRSTSSIVQEYLLGDFELQSPFTTEELYNIMTVKYSDDPTVHISLGGVSGFLAKARQQNALSAVNQDGFYHFAVTDKKALKAMRIREGSTGGSQQGRSINRMSKHLPSIPSIQARLLDLAAELELARTPLSTFSSEELLAELTKRQKAAAK